MGDDKWVLISRALVVSGSEVPSIHTGFCKQWKLCITCLHLLTNLLY